MAHFITITGAKGGVGKTVTTINLACALNEFGRECLIIDGNLEKPNVGLALGFTKIEKSTHTALRGDHRLDEAVFTHPSGIHVIPGHLSLDWKRHAAHKLFKDIVHHVEKKAEIIFIDTPSGLHPDALEMLKTTRQTILITTPSLSAVTDCLKTARIARDNGIEILGVIVNKVKESSFEMELENIETILEVPVIGVIPYDRSIQEAEHHRYPVVYTHRNAPASEAFKKTAANLIGATYEPNLSRKESILSYVLKRTGFVD